MKFWRPMSPTKSLRIDPLTDRIDKRSIVKQLVSLPKKVLKVFKSESAGVLGLTN